ncbi:hypothetical protein CB1_000314020 [Camelus ferus]|nr:hypothetical protein CB1_000314020 [Camelus ferus]
MSIFYMSLRDEGQKTNLASCLKSLLDQLNSFPLQEASVKLRRKLLFSSSSVTVITCPDFGEITSQDPRLDRKIAFGVAKVFTVKVWTCHLSTSFALLA